MAQGKPLIGICGGMSEVKGHLQLGMPANYSDAMAMAGGVPVVLPPVDDLRVARRMLDAVDGVMFIGGSDVDPSRYGQKPHANHKPLHPRRETFDLHLADVAWRRRMPVLAICLGIQVLSIARGGTLVQDVPSQWRKPIRHSRREGERRKLHNVIVEPGSLLASIVGAGRFEVNSSHHQAVDEPGRGLVVTARANDGVIEAIEDPSRPFFLGVQWHPEALTRRALHLALFKAHVKAARAQVGRP